MNTAPNEFGQTHFQDSYLHKIFKMKNKIYKLVSDLENECEAIMHNGKIIKAPDNNNFKTAVYFNNDLSLENSNRSFIQFNCKSFENNELSLSIWVLPKNRSHENSVIFSNESYDKITGLFYNANGEEGELGVLWNEQKNTRVVKLGVNIEENKWTHLVLNFYDSGHIKVFRNGVYVNQLDIGAKNDMVNFYNIKLGGFSGWVDDFKIYPKTLDYGNVTLNQFASENILYLFNKSRITGDYIPPNTDSN